MKLLVMSEGRLLKFCQSFPAKGLQGSCSSMCITCHQLLRRDIPAVAFMAHTLQDCIESLGMLKSLHASQYMGRIQVLLLQTRSRGGFQQMSWSNSQIRSSPTAQTLPQPWASPGSWKRPAAM